MGASKWFFSMSGMILLIGALAIGGKGLNFGIDFTPARASRRRSRSRRARPGAHVLETGGLGDAKIQRSTNRSSAPTSSRSRPSSCSRRVEKLQSALDAALRRRRDFSSSSVGPTFGQTVANSAIIAIIASLLVISAYIALRFQWKFAVPVLIALMHDILITAGIYSLIGREVTSATVAALLTILGYSLYDTIIVFDRIRENMPRMPRAAFSQIVNRSMSEVLTRSLATCFCTLLPILALLLFGGETLRDFAFALLVGVASGTYSSIFIATPVLAHWKEREPVYRRARERIEAEHGGVVPAYATATGGDRSTSTPSERSRRGAPDRARRSRRSVSRSEFDEMVADLGVETSRERPPRRRAGAAAPARRPPRAAPPATAAGAAAAATTDGRAPDDRRTTAWPRSAKRARKQPQPPATGGRADGHARLGHDRPRDLALHDLPARPLLGRDRRRVPRRAVRRVRLRPARSTACSIPGQDDTHLLTGARGRSRARCIGMACVWFLGLRQERMAEHPAI